MQNFLLQHVRKCYIEDLQSIFGVILSTVYPLFSSMDDEEFAAPNSLCLKVNIPTPDGLLEKAVIGNIIRRNIEQDYNILVSSNSDSISDLSDVYIGLICEGYDDTERIESIINNQATQNLLWSYKSKKSNEITISSELFKLGNYPDVFESPEDLSHQFDNKLYRKLVEWFPNSNNRFTIEDHVLIRYSSSSGIKHILFNLWDNYVANTDNYELRETIISDVLNQYCLTG